MTFSEEDYIKAIYNLYRIKNKPVSTNAIAEVMETKPSSVTDMIKKLAQKKLLNYEKYKGVNLTDYGIKIALNIIRKHRLWEVFLVEKLQFKWNEIHEIAEQLEHIHSEKLIAQLDAFLGYPKYDPHGDPIPDSSGNIKHHQNFTIANMQPGESATIIGLKTDNADLLNFLDTNNISLHQEIKVVSKNNFDASFQILVKEKTINITEKTAQNIYVKQLKK